MSLNLAVETKKTYFLPSQIKRLSALPVPKHIAIIPDGNRRWAKKHVSSVHEGHKKGCDALTDIVKAAKEIGVKTITFYSFSTENWNRSFEEVIALMTLYAQYIIGEKEEMVRCGIRLDTIGVPSALPSFLQAAIAETKEATKECEDITLVLALNYGSRSEIARAFQKMLLDVQQGALSIAEVDEERVSHYLDTSPWGDPDLLIRTSGEFRLSNFLLWQISYAEIYVCDLLWPDFTPNHLLEAVVEFQNRERRWGAR